MMALITPDHDPVLSRRKAITGLMMTIALLGTSCSPVRLALNIGKDPEAGEETGDTLQAFLETVVPGARPEEGTAVECFTNEVFGFTKYIRGFVKDLNHKARKEFNTSFPALESKAREWVIRSGLEGNGPVSKLYTGAVFLSQIAVFTGMTNGFNGCALINFDGVFRFSPASTSTTISYFGNAETTDGNPN